MSCKIFLEKERSRKEDARIHNANALEKDGEKEDERILSIVSLVVFVHLVLLLLRPVASLDDCATGRVCTDYLTRKEQITVSIPLSFLLRHSPR